MATLESFFATDSDAEVNGKWFQVGPFEVKLARAGGASNRRYARVYAEKFEPHFRDLQLGTMDPKAEQRVLAETYADAVVMDWRGVEDEAGNAIPCTRENVIAKLTDLPEFFDRIVKAAMRFENFRAALREAASGNSSRS